MDIDALYGIVTDPNNLKSGTLTLANDVFGANGFKTMVTEWFETGNLVIEQIPDGEPKKNGNTVTLSGQMSFLNVTNQAVQSVVFYLADGSGNLVADGDPAVLIVFPLPTSSQHRDPWVFSTSFPALGQSSLDDLTFQDKGSTSSTYFLLSSVALSAANAKTLSGLPLGDDQDIADGLNFYAQALITTTETFTDIGPLLGSAATQSLIGPISILSGSIQQRDHLIPKIKVVSPTTISTSFLGGVNFFLNVVNPWDDTTGQQINPALLIAASMEIAGASITFSANFSNLGKSLVLQMDTGALTTALLTDLATWIGDTSLSKVFETYAFDLTHSVTVKEIRIFLNMRSLGTSVSQSLSAVSISLGTVEGKTWDIVKGYFTVDGIEVSFMLNDPLSKKNLITSVVGTVDLVDSIELEAFGSFPDESFGLSTLAPVNFTQVFKKVGLGSLKGFPELVCQNFYVEATPATKANPDSGVYSVNMDITSDWKIDIGVRDIELTNAGMSLQYAESDTPKVSGQVTAGAKLVAKGEDPDPNVPVFLANWEIPGEFEIKGVFPDINLTDLAKAIANAADLSLPSSFPTIDLTNSTVSLTVESGQAGNQPTGTKYDFFLETTIDLGSDSGLTFVSEIIKSTDSTGFTAGIWTDNWAWSPADLPVWKSTFGTILSGITFEKSGLLVSSLDTTQIIVEGAPSDLPQTVKKGLTFFTEIGFGTSALTKLTHFFGDASGIQLYAVIADPLSNSEFIAKIGESTTTDKYGFTGFEVMISPATETFAIQAGVSFTFTDVSGNDETLTLIGGGALTLTGTFDVYFVLKGEGSKVPPGSTSPPATSQGWVDPLGVKGLTINNFWGEIGVNEEGLLLGFGGDVIIGAKGSANSVELELDIVGEFTEAEVPIVDVFKFAIKQDSPAQSATITQLVSAFTTLDFNWVPILNKVDLKEFMLAVVVIPQGWLNPVTNKLWMPGFRCAGDVAFYGNEALFDIEIDYKRGIKASGEIKKPIDLADGVFVLSDASGSKGPRGMIDTYALTQPGSNKYLELSGTLKLLAMVDTIKAYIANDGWDFEWKSDDFIFEDKIQCSLINSDFTGSVSGSMDLEINTGSGVDVGGIEIIPPIKVDLAGVSLGLKVTINPGFSLTVKGEFELGGESLTFNVGVDITSWSDFKNALIKYLEKYPEKLFDDLANDAEKWAKVVASGAIKMAKDVAYYLEKAFGVADKEAVKILQAIGRDTGEIIKDLENYWGKTEEEAKHLVFEVMSCAMKEAGSILDG